MKYSVEILTFRDSYLVSLCLIVTICQLPPAARIRIDLTIYTAARRQRSERHTASVKQYTALPTVANVIYAVYTNPPPSCDDIVVKS